MKRTLLAVIFATILSAGCNKSSTPSTAAENSRTTPAPMSTGAPAGSNDAVQQKLQEYSGGSGANCGRLDVQAPQAQLKSAGDCAMQAAQDKKPFYVAYDMPGMSIGVAGNSDGKLFTVQSQGGAGLTSGACPSQLRVASSGRISCFAPGDMGSMGAGHTAVGSPMGKMPNPHESSDQKPPKQ